MRIDLEHLRIWGITLGVGVVGALAGDALGLPLPYLLGPLFAGLLTSLCQIKTSIPRPATISVRTILGVAIGTYFQPELIARIGEMALSIAFIPVYLAAIAACGYPYFRKLCGFDRPTAYFSSMPGGLTDMLIFGEDAGANLRALSLVQATRMLVIVTCLPLIMTSFYEVSQERPEIGSQLSDVPLLELVLMGLIAFGGYRIAKALKIFGAAITGPMVICGAASLAGLIENRPPVEVIIFAQLIIGMNVGSKYFGLTLQELKTLVLAAVGFCVIVLALAVIFEQIVVALGAAPPLEAILAFAPGGQAEMTILAIVLGADVAFVALHHVTRVSLVLAFAPLFMRPDKDP